VRHVAGIPLIYSTYPSGLGDDGVYHKSITDAPSTIATVHVMTSTGSHKYVRLNAHNLTWLVAGRFAVELHSWSPALNDPQRAAFGRITLAPNGSARIDRVIASMELLRDALSNENLRSIAILDGFRGAAVWIPFDDAPGYARLGPWLHAFASLKARVARRLATRDSAKECLHRKVEAVQHCVLAFTIYGSKAGIFLA
jgi:DNA primase